MSLIWSGPLLKPSRIERILRKLQFRKARKRQKLINARDDRAKAHAYRTACFGRDQGKCRACKKVAKLYSDNELDLGHAHHIIFRSAGGSDELPNRIFVCAWCHDLIHRGLLHCSGDGNADVEFILRNIKGQRAWSSPCPN